MPKKTHSTSSFFSSSSLTPCQTCTTLLSAPSSLQRLQISNSHIPICPATDKPTCSLRAIANQAIKAHNEKWAERDNFTLVDDPSQGFVSVWASKSPTGQRKGWYDIDTLELRFIPRTRSGNTCLLRFDIFPLEESAGRYLTARVGLDDLASDEAFERVREWMEDCERHERCPEVADVPLPTRVVDVDVGNNERARVKETRGEMGRYVALSYCWGGPQVVALTKTSKAWMEKGINIADLPKTLQDAVFVTRKLGMRYLWVDALCITQDSKEDMEKELETMGQTYRYATTTISAACATSVQQGFLHQREPKPSMYPRLTLPYRAWSDGPSVGVTLQEENQYDPRTEPINSRAWTLQERLLSPRLPIYGTRELVWQCQQTSLTANGTAKITPDGSERLEGAFSNGRLSLAPDSFWKSWKATVVDYTNRNTSFAEDKLVAIAGLASEFHRQNQDDMYLAGLWRRNLPEGLMWMMDTMVMDEIGAWQAHPRPAAYVAPSWSWASVTGLVEFDTTTTCTEEGQPYIEVVGCDMKLENSDIPTGKVVGGTLKAKGCLRDARWDGITLFDGPTASAKPHGVSWMDAEEAKPDVVSCLRVCSDRGLMLAPTKVPSTFRRVGVFQVAGGEDDYPLDACDEWFNECDIQTIHIV